MCLRQQIASQTSDGIPGLRPPPTPLMSEDGFEAA